MTDARFPERWLNDRRIMRLNAHEFRAYVLSLTWAVSNRTDGRIDRADMDMVPGCSMSMSAAALVEARLWEPTADGSGWEIVDFLATQTPRDQLEGLERRRRNDAKRSKDYRHRKKSADQTDPSREEPRDPSRDASRDDIGQARTGQDRPGQADSPRAISESWSGMPVRQPGSGLPAAGVEQCPGCGDSGCVGECLGGDR